MARKKITDLLGLELADLQSSRVSADNEASTSVKPEQSSIEVTESESLEVTKTSNSEASLGEDKAGIESQKEAASEVFAGSGSRTSKLTESDTAGVPKYLQLERKEVRVRMAQMESLTTLSRQLNRKRKGQGERLTENTLIRVAIDLLLQNATQLEGTTEDELLASLKLPLSDSLHQK